MKILDLKIHDFFQTIQKIRYGYKDKDGNLHFENDHDFLDYEYRFSSCEEIIQNNCGWCWDIANLISTYCQTHNIKHVNYFIEYHDSNYHITHTQVFLELENKWYFAVDNSTAEPFGFISYHSKEDCISSFIDDFKSYLNFHLKENYNEQNLFFNEFNCEFKTNIDDKTYLNLVRK